jgi:hypothetical protein
MRCHLLALCFSLLPLAAHAGDDLAAALTGGDVNADINLRYEHVAREGVNDAEALTIRSRVGYTTGAYYGLSGKLEIENVWSPFDVNYDNGVNGRTSFARIPDPQSTEINQGYLQFAAYDTTLRAGRQVITFDDRYFVGDSAWRQNQTSYDGLRLETKALPHVTANYAYVFDEHNNIGNASSAGSRGSDSHLLNVKTDVMPGTDLRAFVYRINLDDKAPTLSSSTYGIEAAPKYKVAQDWTLSGLASYAYQQDAARNPNNYGLNFYRVVGGADYQQINAKLGYEVFEGNGTASFTRPFGNNFSPQGRSDVISTKVTIPNGLRDYWARLEYRLAGVHEAVDGLLMGGEYHSFEAQHISRHYGSEYNLYLNKNFGDRFTAELVWADYSADKLSFDTQKLVAQFTVKF